MTSLKVIRNTSSFPIAVARGFSPLGTIWEKYLSYSPLNGLALWRQTCPSQTDHWIMLIHS